MKNWSQKGTPKWSPKPKRRENHVKKATLERGSKKVGKVDPSDPLKLSSRLGESSIFTKSRGLKKVSKMESKWSPNRPNENQIGFRGTKKERSKKGPKKEVRNSTFWAPKGDPEIHPISQSAENHVRISVRRAAPSPGASLTPFWEHFGDIWGAF